ncbi:MAG: thermonuclease family protein [Pseudomonadota bacterium]
MRVIDGDTIEATLYLTPKITMRNQIQLANIDTPRINGAKCNTERKLGQAAKLFVEESFAMHDGRAVVSISPKEDRFGRLVASVTLGPAEIQYRPSPVSRGNELVLDLGDFLQENMVRAGLAVVWKEGDERTDWCSR